MSIPETLDQFAASELALELVLAEIRELTEAPVLPSSETMVDELTPRIDGARQERTQS